MNFYKAISKVRISTVPGAWESKSDSDMEAMKACWQGALVEFTGDVGFGYVPTSGTSVRFKDGEYELRIVKDGSTADSG